MPFLVLQAKGRLHPWIAAMLAASTRLKIPHPAHAVPISLSSEMSYPVRVSVSWLCCVTCMCARWAFECWTRFSMNSANTNAVEVDSVQSSRRPRTVSITSTPLRWWFPRGNLVGCSWLLWHRQEGATQLAYEGGLTSSTQSSFT